MSNIVDSIRAWPYVCAFGLAYRLGRRWLDSGIAQRTKRGPGKPLPRRGD